MRPSWDEYFLNIADAVSKRATCPRRSVGVVIVKDNRIVSCGYNGAPPGAPHCIDEGCAMVNDHCIRSLHAEINAIKHTAHSKDLHKATIYCSSGCPCRACGIVIVRKGIARIVYKGTYMDNSTVEDFKRFGVLVEELNEN